jgi:ATP-dependent helicase/nuclease subunit A
MSEAVLTDCQAREAIHADLDTCLLVDAGAGSGKTSSLVGRMVALIKEGKCRVETMAAVTFTRKAAAELQGRFQLELERKFADETDPRAKELLGQALLNLNHCFLGTVHSFCAAILRERPVEAGLDPEFQEMDDLEDTLLRDRAWSEYLLRIEAESPGMLAGLDEIGIQSQDLQDFYNTVSAYPEVEVVSQDCGRPDLSELQRQLAAMLEMAARLLPPRVPPGGWDDLQKVLKQALRWRRYFRLDNDNGLLRLLGKLDRNCKIVQKKWNSPADAKTALAAVDNFRVQYLRPVLRQWREYRHWRIVDFVLPAADYYRQLRRDSSQLNYQDLLMETTALLRENPEVRRYFQSRYTHLLVDEFQDTDPLQAEIIFYLTGTVFGEKDWRRLVPRPGSLFVVGDPKQSIYRFRRADIDTYNEVKKLITAAGGRSLSLTTSFRSLNSLGDWINPSFSSFFPPEADQCQAAFAGLKTVRPDMAGCTGGVRVNPLPPVERHRAGDIAALDAARIAAWIRMALDGGISLARSTDEINSGLTGHPRPGDFLILLWNKKRMDCYARALEQQGIPFQIAGGAGFTSSPELSELLKLGLALLDSDDPVRLTAVLRGLFFGFSDNLLYRFKVAGGKFHIDSDLPAQLDKDDLKAMDQAFSQLRQFRDWTHRLPACAALEKIINGLGVLPCALCGEMGQSRAGYLKQTLEYASKAEGRGITSFSSLMDYLVMLMENGVEDEIDIFPGQNDVVRLMNLHKAKGLEAPVVFLANPGKQTPHPPVTHILRGPGRPQGYFVVQKQKEHGCEVLGQPTGWDAYAAQEQQYLDAEEVRLLYVAATRARNLLVISTYPAKADGWHWHAFQDYLKDVPELVDGSVCLPSTWDLPQAGNRCLGMEDFTTAAGSWLEAGGSWQEPSYRLVAVTALAKSEAAMPPAATGSKGLAWGRVVHRALEACTRDIRLDLPLLVANLLQEEERDPAELEQAVELIRGILASPLWQRMTSSQVHYVEVPLAVNEGDTTVSGVIDLVFREAAGWVIVDYKTDSLANGRDLAAKAAYYAPQVRMYSRCWEQLSGEGVCEAGLYFTSLGKWVVVP